MGKLMLLVEMTGFIELSPASLLSGEKRQLSCLCGRKYVGN